MEKKHYISIVVIVLLAFFAAQYSQSIHSFKTNQLTGNIVIVPEGQKIPSSEPKIKKEFEPKKEPVQEPKIKKEPETAIEYFLQWFNS